MKFATKDAFTQLGIPGLVSILFPAIAGVVVSHYGFSQAFGGSKGKFAISNLLASVGTAIMLSVIFIRNGNMCNKSNLKKMFQEVIIGSNEKSTTENPNIESIH